VKEYRAEQHIIRREDSKAELSSEELMASTKGQLQPVAKLDPSFVRSSSLYSRLCGLGGVTPPNLQQIRSARYVIHHNPRIIVVIYIT
jgi:hypothetical protein